MITVLAALLLILLLLAAYFAARRVSSTPLPTTTVTIRDAQFTVEVADTLRSRMQGLSGRASLGAQNGMLFRFNRAGTPGFWMPDMHFPIDMIWIRDGVIHGITPDVQPEPGKTFISLKRYYPPEPVDMVLELNAGTAARYGFVAGDTVIVR